MTSVRKWKKEFKKKPVVVFSCTSCNEHGCGRDLRYDRLEDIPEVCSMECPVCCKHTLLLDRKRTKKTYGINVPLRYRKSYPL